MGINKKFIQENYARMSDRELIGLAANDAKDLTPEALVMLNEEINRRELGKNMDKAIELQSKQISEEEFDRYIEAIRNLPCPGCSSTDHKLNGALYAEAVSVIFFTNLSVRLKIACPSCLDKIVKKARTRSMLLGWWGLPWGVIRTPKAININDNSLSQNHLMTPTDALKRYVFRKIGEIELYHDSQEELIKIATYTD
jgi:predicted metal-binding protein